MTDIGFNNIPADQRIPGTYPEVEGDIPGQPPEWALILGQSLLNAPSVPILISSVATAVRQFGAGSMLASACERYLAVDPNGTLWALGLQDFGTTIASVGMTNNSAAITGLPAGLTNGLSITGAGVPAGAKLATYNAGAGTGTLSTGLFTGATGTVSVTFGGVAATGQVAFAGTATAAGMLSFYVAGRLVQVPVAAGDTATTAAANLTAGVNAYYDANDLGLKKRNRSFLGVKLPVTASVTSATMTVTSNNKGSLGNFIDLEFNYLGTQGREQLPDGLTVTVTAMSGGVGDPDISGLDAILGDTRYDCIIEPYTSTAAFTAFNTLMSDSAGRWLPSRKVFGHVWTAASFGSNGSNAVTFGLTNNYRHITCICYEQSCPMPPWDVAAAYAAANFASLRADPARPTHGLAIPGLLAPRRHQRFTYATQQTLLGTGLALMSYNADYSCSVLRAVTTYQTDINGTPDKAYRDTETLYTLQAVVRQMVGDWGAAFPRAKIIDDGVSVGPGSSFNAGLPDQPVVTIKSGKAVLVASYARMATGAGSPILVTSLDYFSDNLVLQRNSQDPTRYDALLPITLASGLRVTAMKFDFSL